jgi:flagellar hook-length control protein FliK
MTLKVAPEAIGPVTVRAHITTGGIHIELAAPNDEGRAALGAILPDLKRDLAQGGMNAAVTVHPHSFETASSGSSFTGGQDGRQSLGQSASDLGGRGAQGQPTAATSASTRAQDTPAAVSSRTSESDRSLDVLA